MVHSEKVFSTLVLISSDEAGNFIDHHLAEKLLLLSQLLEHPLKLYALDRDPIGDGSVTHCTKPIHLFVGALQLENIPLLVTITANFLVMVGFLCQPLECLLQPDAHLYKWKMIFSITSGHFEYCVMPY